MEWGMEFKKSIADQGLLALLLNNLQLVSHPNGNYGELTVLQSYTKKTTKKQKQKWNMNEPHLPK